GTGQIDLGAQRQQRRRKIAAEAGEAHAPAFRRDMTDAANRLEAMIVGGAPPFALVVEQAARVEAEVAAYGAHTAVCGPGNEVRCLSEDSIVRAHLRVRGELGEPHCGADLEFMRIGLD